MEHACIRQTELPNVTQLFADYLYHPDRVAKFYSFSPLDPDAYARAAAQIQFPDERRRALVAALRRHNGDHPLLDKLAQPGTVVVVTGQQVGLFSGPAYSVYKALTAIALAARLTERGIPAVPIFWLATEDHDFAEVNQAWLFNPQNDPAQIVAKAAQRGTESAGNVVIENSHWENAADVMRGLPFADDAVQLIRDTYQPGRTFGAAFSSLLNALLGKFGLLQIDPLDPEIRKLGAPLLREAVLRAPHLTNAQLARTKALSAAGYHSQVHIEAKTSLFFLLKDGQRISLRRTPEGYTAPGAKFTNEELSEQGTSLSPNALLRPVMQDYMLPTIAYVGGPAELAYLAQSQVLYQDLLGRQPVAVPRAGFTLVDQRGAKLMDHTGLTAADVFQGDEQVRTRIAAKLVPPSVHTAMASTRREASNAMDRLSRELLGFDASLDSALTTSRRKIEYQLAKIDHKVAREALRRDERATAAAASLSGLLYPHKHMQERFYSIIPFVAKYGVDVIDRVQKNLQLDCHDHQVLQID
jgi:bacillithiol biosynthesis cysteine-adding enzyme BshC